MCVCVCVRVCVCACVRLYVNTRASFKLVVNKVQNLTEL